MIKWDPICRNLILVQPIGVIIAFTINDSYRIFVLKFGKEKEIGLFSIVNHENRRRSVADHFRFGEVRRLISLWD